MAASSETNCLGYTMQDLPRAHAAITLGKRQREFNDMFSTLTQWELIRFFEPQGPIKLSNLPWDHFKRWSTSKLSPQDARTAMEEWCFSQNISSSTFPTPTLPETHKQIAQYSIVGDSSSVAAETRASDSGCLVYRASLQVAQVSSSMEVRIKLVAAIMGASCRLWRRYPTRRLLRISIDEKSEGLLQGRGVTYLQKSFKSWLAIPLLINGLYYRCFYHKEGTLYFWAEDGAAVGYPMTSVSTFLNELVPFLDGINDGMSLAKLVARIKLWLSKTVDVAPVDEVRWQPDLTNHTLPISLEQMDRISRKMCLGYRPLCITGIVKGRQYTWSLDKEIPLWHIGVYKEMFEADVYRAITSELASKKTLAVEFQVHVGFQRKLVRQEIAFTDKGPEQRRFYLKKQPDYEEQVMTDGCGLLSYALSRDILDIQGTASIPTAVQGRLEGAKGMWIIEMRPDANDQKRWITVTPSQLKYMPGETATWNLELIAASQPSKSGSIGPQLFRLLTRAQLQESHNPAIISRLQDLRVSEEESLCDSLLQCKDRALLRHHVESTEKAFKAGDSSSRRILGEKEKEDEDVLEQKVSEGEPEVDPTTGRPNSLAARAIAMIDAGFSIDPMEPNLQDHLEKIVRSERTWKAEMERIPVLCSRNFFVLPDHWGILQEGEIFCQMSGDTHIDPITKLRKSNDLRGPVLITRSPCVQPTDVQIVKAVSVPDFMHMHDVVICSTKGKQSLLSKLSGGDYDGDTVQIIFDPVLVRYWDNANDSFLTPDFQEADYFENIVFMVEAQQVSTVGELRDALSARCNPSVTLQSITTAALFVQPMYGVLATLHQRLLEHPAFGPRHWKTARCGHLYTTALDAAKAGKVFRLTSAEITREIGPTEEQNINSNAVSTSGETDEEATVGDRETAQSDPQGAATPSASPARSAVVSDPVTPVRGMTSRLTQLSTSDPAVSPSSSKRLRQESSSGSSSPSAKQKVSPLSDSDLAAPWQTAFTEAKANLLNLQTTAAEMERKVAMEKVDRRKLRLEEEKKYLDDSIWHAERKQEWLSSLYEHVKEARNLYAKWYENWRGYSDKDRRPAILEKEKILRDALVSFYYDFLERHEDDSRPVDIDANTARRLAASCAYSYAMFCGQDGDADRVNGFPLLVAFRTLLDIKADAVDGGQYGAPHMPRQSLSHLKSVAKPLSRLALALKRSLMEGAPPKPQGFINDSDEEDYEDAKEEQDGVEDEIRVIAEIAAEGVDEYASFWYDENDEVYNDSGIGPSQEAVMVP